MVISDFYTKSHELAILGGAQEGVWKETDGQLDIPWHGRHKKRPTRHTQIYHFTKKIK